MFLVDAADGSVHAPFDNVFVPGLAFPNGARLGFAARTGGAADEFNIDNVNVQFIPEPSSVALAIVAVLAGLTVAYRRRRAAAA